MNGWGISKNQNEGFRYYKQGAQLGETNLCVFCPNVTHMVTVQILI